MMDEKNKDSKVNHEFRNKELERSSAESEVKIAGDDGQKSLPNEDPKLSEIEKGQSGYGLRENPRKTLRIVFNSKHPLPQWRVCKECGEGFWSLRALCGHMAIHSEKKNNKGSKSDHLWNGPKVVSGTGRCSDIKEPEEELRIQTESSGCRKKLKKIDDKSSTVSEIDEELEVAECMLMLSRAPVIKGRVNSIAESSDTKAVAMEAKSPSIPETKSEKLKTIPLEGEFLDSDSEYFLSAESVSYTADGLRTIKDSSKYKISFSERVRRVENESRKRKHRSLEDDSRDHDTDNVRNFASFKPSGSSFQCAKKKVKSKKNNNNEPHVCPICNKVFKNGQAYGGHKRSHLAGGNNNKENVEQTAKREIPYLPDLNFPALEADI